MKLLRMLIAVVTVCALLMAAPKIPRARVMMTGNITGFGMDMRPTADLTVDDWLNTPGMFTLTITNGDIKTVKYAIVEIDITSSTFGTVLTGTLTVVNSENPKKAFLAEMTTGQSFTIQNTMITEKSDQMETGDWSTEFKDEVLRIGAMPEGTYTMRFTLKGYYGSADDPIDEWSIDHYIEVKNPTPPELITPDDMSDDVVTIPRFAWQRPQVSDYTNVNNRVIDVFYNLRLWKMFEEDGTVIMEEDAINRIPIWELRGIRAESWDFDPGTSREELISGRKYCWQVQAVDGTGRPISSINNGKSDVWEFTCQFSPPSINEPLNFYPFSFSWTAARAGGGLVLYRVRIADNPDFAGGFREDGLVMTNFTYPDDAPTLRLGVTYYLELQATDDGGIPIGRPETTSFMLPSAEIALSAPPDGSTASTSNPRFSWQSPARTFVVLIFDEASDWSYMSGPLTEKSWTYDGEDLQPGRTYAWNVSPANEAGEPMGESSETWYFTLASENQMILVSPVNQEVDSTTPTFTWKALPVEGTVNYTILIEDSEGNAVHSATVTSTSYPYPADAPELAPGARYQWSVNGEQNNVEIGLRSEPASFTTPLAAGAQEATMADVTSMILNVLTNYPQYASFQDKVIVSISDETGPLTPNSFLELFESYKLVEVNTR